MGVSSSSSGPSSDLDFDPPQFEVNYPPVLPDHVRKLRNIYGKYKEKSEMITLGRKKFLSIGIRGDGNCFFRCLSAIILGDFGLNHAFFRTATCKLLEQNKTKETLLLECINGESIDEYIARAKRNKEYVDDLLIAMAKLLTGRSLIIHRGYSGTNTGRLYLNDNFENDEHPPIHLHNTDVESHNAAHYNLLIDPNEIDNDDHVSLYWNFHHESRQQEPAPVPAPRSLRKRSTSTSSKAKNTRDEPAEPQLRRNTRRSSGKSSKATSKSSSSVQTNTRKKAQPKTPSKEKARDEADEKLSYFQKIENKYKGFDKMYSRIAELRSKSQTKTFMATKRWFTMSKSSEKSDLFNWAQQYCKSNQEGDEGVKKILAALACDYRDLVPKKSSRSGSAAKRNSPRAHLPAELSERARKRKKTLKQAAEALENAKPKERTTKEEFLQGKYPSCIKIDEDTTKKGNKKLCRVAGCSKNGVSASGNLFCYFHYTQIVKFREKESLEPFVLDPRFGEDMDKYMKQNNL